MKQWFKQRRCWWNNFFYHTDLKQKIKELEDLIETKTIEQAINCQESINTHLREWNHYKSIVDKNVREYENYKKGVAYYLDQFARINERLLILENNPFAQRETKEDED